MSCTNPNPNAQETAQVNANFRTAAKIPAQAYVWVGAPAA